MRGIWPPRTRIAVAATVGLVAIAAVAVALIASRGQSGPIRVAVGAEPMRSPTPDLPFAFRVTPYRIGDLPDAERAYATTRAPDLEDTTHPRAPDGARLAIMEEGAAPVDHPVAQAQDALGMLEGYRLTGDERYLRIAVADAERLLDRGVRSGGALYLPYPFDFPRHSDPNDEMRPPWYSAMAQGQALSVFTRLFEVTGEQRWRDAADAIFASFRLTRDAVDPGAPWTVFVDEDGYYWLEEYAGEGIEPDLTFNGLVFAVYGLVDYAVATGDDDAELLAQAALTTVRHALPGIRVPGELSRYCLTHAVQDAGYHAIHVAQMRMLARITGDPDFGEWADLLEADHPVAG